MKALIVANPVSGAGLAAAQVPGLVNALRAHGLETAVYFTTPDDGDPALDAAILASDLAIAIGGDGTLHRVIRPIVLAGASNVGVGFLPAGTGNVAGRALRIPRTTESIAETAAAARYRALDAGVVSGPARAKDAMVLWAGAGLDGALIHAVARSRKSVRGWRVFLRYVLESPAVLAGERFTPIAVDIDGVAHRATSATVGNIGALGWGRLSADARPADGQFDVVLGSLRSRLAWALAGVLGAVVPFDRLPGFQRVRGTAIALSGDPSVCVQIDGEPLGHLPFAVEMRAGAIRMLDGRKVVEP